LCCAVVFWLVGFPALDIFAVVFQRTHSYSIGGSEKKKRKKKISVVKELQSSVAKELQQSEIKKLLRKS
jgi:hypothetical protein